MWNPVTLRFADADAERQFIVEFLDFQIKLDALGYCAGALLGCFAAEEGPLGLRLLWIAITLLMAPCWGMMAVFRKEIYIKYRTGMILALLGTASVHCCLREASLPPPESVQDLIFFRFVKSSGMIVCFGFLAFRFLFRNQLLMNVYWIAQFRIWSWICCVHCDGSNAAFNTVVDFLARLDSSIVLVLSLAPNQPVAAPHESCSRVLLFNKATLAIFIPSYFLYNSELAFRAEFLVRGAAADARARILDFKNTCQGSSLWVLICVSIVAWAMF